VAVVPQDPRAIESYSNGVPEAVRKNHCSGDFDHLNLWLLSAWLIVLASRKLRWHLVPGRRVHAKKAATKIARAAHSAKLPVTRVGLHGAWIKPADSSADFLL